MGFLDDLLQHAGRAGSAVFGPPGSGSAVDILTSQSPMQLIDRRNRALQFARDHGYTITPASLRSQEGVDEAFARDYPEMAHDIEAGSTESLTKGVALGTTGIGAGAMGAAERAAAAAPGTSGSGALTAARAAQPQPGLPGMGSSQGSMPAPQAPPVRATIPQGTNPNVPAPTNPAASQPPLPGMPAQPWSTLPPPGSGGMPPIQGPAVPPTPPLQGPAIGPLQGPAIGPLQGPAIGPLQGPAIGPLQGPAAPPAQPGMLTSAWQAVQAHPIVAGAAAIGSGIVAGGAAGAAARSNAAPVTPRGQIAPGWTPSTGMGPEQTPGYTIGQDMTAEQAKKDQADAEAARTRNDEANLIEQQAAYAKAQHDELDRRVATMDLTDSEKEKLHAQLQQALDAQNNAARSGDVATQETGANARNAATIAGQARNTDVTEAGATSRNNATNATSERNVAAQETGANARTASTNATSERNVAAQETGANTRSGYEGQVTQRGQDINERNAQRQYVVGQAANLVARGQLSEKKAHDFVEDYIKREKLPSDILQAVSTAITPMLPYMRNGAPGDTAPGFESGGAYEQLAHMAGVKHPAKVAGYSGFSLTDLAKQYGGGPGQAQSAPLDLNAVYNSGPDTSEAAAAAYDQKNANDAASGAPSQVQMPSAIQNVTQQVAPMDPDTQQRIYNGIR